METLFGEGGLQYPDINHVDRVLKASWFKRISKSIAGLASFPAV